MSDSDLAADSKVTPIAKVPGAYACTLPDHWNYVAPCGGVLMTVALRAMQAELADPSFSLLSATTVFCQAVQPGELTIEVRVLRLGESAAQVRASLGGRSQPGPGLEVIATFTKDRPGPDVHGVQMPSVPPPDRAMATRTRTRDLPFNFYRNVDLALALGEPMWEPGWAQGPAHTAFWYRYRAPQRTPAGLFDPLAIPPLADTMPPALTRRLGPDHERYMMPSLDLTVYVVAPTTSEWILVESFCERARAGYATGSASLWDEQGQLVARASQTMTLRKPRR